LPNSPNQDRKHGWWLWWQVYVSAKGVVVGDQISPSATFILEGPSILGPSPDQINNLGNTTRENGLHTQEEKTRTMDDEEEEGTWTTDKWARTPGWMMVGGEREKTEIHENI